MTWSRGPDVRQSLDLFYFNVTFHAILRREPIRTVASNEDRQDNIKSTEHVCIKSFNVCNREINESIAISKCHNDDTSSYCENIARVPRLLQREYITSCLHGYCENMAQVVWYCESTAQIVGYCESTAQVVGYCEHTAQVVGYCESTTQVVGYC